MRLDPLHKTLLALLIGSLMLSWLLMKEARAEEEIVAGYSVERLADAIYLAEGGAKTRHPYGILTKYKTTTPRQACINTIRHKYRDWVELGSHGDFLAYLQGRYCPIGAANDPTGLNKNWLSNVKQIYSSLIARHLQ